MVINMAKLKSDHYKRNYLLMVLEGSFYMGGSGFFSITTVIPVFIDMMTHSKQLVGLTITLGSFATYLGRLIIGPFMPHVKNHARFATIGMFICRPQMLLPAFLIFTGHTLAAASVLIISYVLFTGTDGIIVPAWTEVLANTVDENRHGRLIGTQILLGGIASIGAGVIINVFLNSPALNIKTAFGWIFLLGGLLFTVSCFMMAFTENAPNTYKTGKIDFKGYYKALPKYLKIEKDNTKMLIVQFFNIAAGMCTPFVILFARDRLGVSNKVFAGLILVQSIGIPLGGWLWGQICDRLGIIAGMKLAGINILLIAILPLFAMLIPANPLLFLVPTMILAGVSSGTWTCYYIYTVQAVRRESRASCLALTSLVIMPASLSSYLAGYISDKFGYPLLFIISIAIAAVSIIGAFKIRPVMTVLEERSEEVI